MKLAFAVLIQCLLMALGALPRLSLWHAVLATAPFAFLLAGGRAVLTRARRSRLPFLVNRLRHVPYGVFNRVTRRKFVGHATIEKFVAGKQGLEIGGPTPIFRGGRLIPVYDRCSRIDNCNFSEKTIWDNSRDQRMFGAHRGRSLVGEAWDLPQVFGGSYDFVLASHVLEHVANPMRALLEWRRILAPGGGLLIIVPDKRATFDHLRPYTTLDHIEADYERGVAESDLTHLGEVLALHDLSLDPPAGTWEEFRVRCLRNPSLRAMHHHVFSPEVLVRMLSLARMQVLSVGIERPFHLIVFAQKPNSEEPRSVELPNASFIEENAAWRRGDPLRRDVGGQTN